MNAIDILQRNPHFAGLRAADLEAIAHAFSAPAKSDGKVFFKEGDRDDALYLVLEGEVVATHKERLREHVVRRYGAGDLFGLSSLIDGGPRRATCTAAGPCAVATMRREAFQLLRQQSAPVACAFQKALAAQLARDFRRTEDRLRALLPRTPDGGI
jgi:CRP/FNR family transcriptional regulator